jgi:hypothetical protein
VLPLYYEIGDPEKTGDQLTNIGYIHSMKGDLKEALKWYGDALPLYEQSGNQEKAEITRKNILTAEAALGGGSAPRNSIGSEP